MSTVYTLDENLMCWCGHSWEEHHSGCVMNKDYVDYPLNIDGCIAQECEHNQVNGEYFLRRGEKKYCMCRGFHPRARNVQKMVDEWVKKHDEMRKQKNG
jgi:hypothetical protein